MQIKIRWLFLHFLFTAVGLIGSLEAQDTQLRPAVTKLTIQSGEVTILHLCPGYVTSVRLPEEVSSVVLGDPKNFKAEHSEAEPRLVFLKPLQTRSSQTNALITTKAGQEIALQLLSRTTLDGDTVDFLLDYERPRSFLVPETSAGFQVAESINAADGSEPRGHRDNPVARELAKQMKVSAPSWQGKQLQVGVGKIVQDGSRMVLSFSVLNNSESAIDLLAPQIQLSGPTPDGNKKIKAEPIPVENYVLSNHHLAPGQRTDGVIVFDRPAFKESNEQLLLQVAQAAEVDRPMLVPVPFTAMSLEVLK